MELIEAEEASGGEVGCGVPSDKLAKYLNNRSINITDESLRTLLREYLGYILTERDYDKIISQVSRYIESIVEEVNYPTTTETNEYIPTTELQQLLTDELGEHLPQTSIAAITQYTQQVIHKAVLQPQYTWPNPTNDIKKRHHNLHCSSNNSLYSNYPHQNTTSTCRRSAKL